MPSDAKVVLMFSLGNKNRLIGGYGGDSLSVGIVRLDLPRRGITMLQPALPT